MKQKLLLLFAVLSASLSAWAGNTITYTASAKLSLTSSYFTPGFTSHDYDENTQTGTLTFPSDVTKIGNWAFQNKTALTSINLPNTVTEIGTWAFKSCTNLTSITLPNSIQTIDDSSFRDSGLTSITIPGSVTSIGDCVFTDCTSLSSVVIENSDGNSVTTIGDCAFSRCTSLTSIVIGNSVTSMGNDVFINSNKLKSITSMNPIPPTLGTDVFKNVPSKCYLYVPVEGYMAYKEADQWKGFYNRKAQAGTLALNDEMEYKIDQNVSGCTLSYTRTVSSDNWMGVYLPFEVDVTKVEGTYATLTDVTSEGILEWTTVESGTISWGTPFIFKPNAAGTFTFTSSDGTLHKNTDVNHKTIGDYNLAGTYLTKSDMQGIYGLANGNFFIGGSNAQPLKPYRIFLTVPASVSQSKAPVRSRINGVDATGIEELAIEPSSIDNFMFNLQGVRVDDNYKGIVIVNGKKVIRK